MTYVDKGPFQSLRVTRLNLKADNIRNAHSREREYPSDLHLDGVVFDTRGVALDGHADFLAEPFPGIRATVALSDIDLGYFQPLTRRAHLDVRRGRLSADGLLEYAPRIKVADLRQVAVRDVEIEYVHTPRAAIGRLLENAFVRAILPGLDAPTIPKRPPPTDKAGHEERTPPAPPG